ncbi:extracellular solute-binding protein [Solibaculum mannosilyticum]|uniref:Putative 2-aminoethylphosphonate ABC transporter substrate-binding protein n=1 Tax=Solibaculum mannosilyticum TaxID=2780922 RepID=A0A7I8D6S3_9FIRM|nr:extracellular solute-binding protein [Solibaculum mannosilyticum]BCI61189.1 putative 2-aminoethylphosphonate ABC transporter substrate-binding protein [Solibaculum mannosilyticum]
MKKGIVALLLVTLLFTLMADFGGKESIVICSSAEQFRNDCLQEKLNEKFPQYNVIVMYMPTGKTAAKILTEGKNTEVDMLVGVETGYLRKIQDSLADISGRSNIQYIDGLGPENYENRWVTWERFAGAIIVNTEVLEKHGLEAPKTYEDLLKPEYKNLVAMPDPKSSGTGYFFYKNWVNTMGEDEALAYVDKLHDNLKQFTESGSGPIKMLTQGEVAVGLGMTFQAVSEINEGQPFEIIYPPTGSPYSLTGTALIDGHQDKTGVSEVFDYIINDFLVYDKENFSPELVLEDQKNNIPNYPQDIQYADMTGIEDVEEKERLLSIWKY